MATGAGETLNRFTGKWYDYQEAREVEKRLRENEWTGVGWVWKNERGETIAHSW